MSANLKAAEIEQLGVLLRCVRTDDHAERYFSSAKEKWSYRRTSKPLDESLLVRHVNGGPHVGAYLMKPGSTETLIAVFDLDDHTGELGWERMSEVAVDLARAARAHGLLPWPVRSGGGHGVHLFFRWDDPQSAAAVRELMTRLLDDAGLKNGEGGVANGEVEIFPKRDDVEKTGHCIALPFGRESVALGDDMRPAEAVAQFVSSHPVVCTTSQHAGAAQTGDTSTVEAALKFVAADDYSRWIDIGHALKGQFGDDGFVVWDAWSRRSDKYPGEEEARRKWRTDIKPNGKITCGSVFRWAREAGWTGAQSAMGEQPWPAPLAAEAFHGLAGEVVRAIEPHSEADPAALLVQFLTAFGNCVGRYEHYRVEGDRHYSNLFAVLVGRTSKARKGTSWGRVREMFLDLEDLWIADRVKSGLSSGEGLIWDVRDPVVKMEKDKATGELVEKIVDEGVFDKRLLVQESEFAGTLRVMMRDGSTLSRIIRDAWDRGDLASMTKNSPARATGAHISIVGHVTEEELRRYLDVTETANGFANRFIFVCAERSKVLPLGGSRTPEMALAAHRLKGLIGDIRDRRERQSSEQSAELRWTDEARALWIDVYESLSDARPGMFGAITARAEAQVVRLALVYALLDNAAAIELSHLRAALAVWRYAEASAAHVFGASLGDPIADTVLSGLRAAGPKGLSRTELSSLFAGHKSAAALERALSLLAQKRLAKGERRETGGRPTEIWRTT